MRKSIVTFALAFIGTVLFIIVMLALFGGCARANELPAMLKPIIKPPKTVDRQYLITMGVLAASKAADAWTTERALERGGHEGNPIFGPLPSRKRLVGVNVAYLAGEGGLAYLLKRYGRRHWWSKVWMIEPVWQTGWHVRYSYINAGMVLPGRDWRRK